MSVSVETSGAAAVTISDGTAAAAAPNQFSDGFKQRLYGLAPLVCQAVIREDPTTAGHNSRANFARQVLTNPKQFVDTSLIYVITMDGATTYASTDQAIANRLGDIWDDLSYGF